MTFIASTAVLLLVVFFMKADTQSSHVIQAFEGDDAQLPCVYPKDKKPLPENPRVIWKDPVNGNMGKFNRTDDKGSFTLTIKNVTRGQSGDYECNFRDVDFKLTVKLNVTAKTSKTESPSDGFKSHATVSHISAYVLILGSVYLFI